MSQEDAKKWIVERQVDVAEVFSVSPSTVKDWTSRGMPGATGSYALPAISRWLRTSGPWAPKAKPDSDDPLLTPDAGDSPALERYRLAKAQIAEFELAERMGKLLEVDKSRAVFLRWATILRRTAEQLGKRYGNDSVVALNDALQECELVIEDELGPANDSATQ